MVQERYFGIGEEATFKTAVAATKYIDIEAEKIMPYRTYIMDRGAGSQAIRTKRGGREGAAGNVTFPVRPDNITNFLKWCFGTVTSTQQGATSAYKHTFNFSDGPVKSFTGRVGKEVHEEVYAGMLVDSLAFGSTPDDDLTVVPSLIGGKAMVTASIGTPSFSTLDTFVYHENTAKIGGSDSTIVEAFGLMISRNISDFRVAKSKELPRIVCGPRTVGGSMRLDFVSTDELNRFVNDTTTSLEFLFEGASIGATGYKYTIDFKMPKIYYTAAPTPSVMGRARLQADANYHALYDSGIAGEIQVYVINEETTI